MRTVVKILVGAGIYAVGNALAELAPTAWMFLCGTLVGMLIIAAQAFIDAATKP